MARVGSLLEFRIIVTQSGPRCVVAGGAPNGSAKALSTNIIGRSRHDYIAAEQQNSAMNTVSRFKPYFLHEPGITRKARLPFPAGWYIARSDPIGSGHCWTNCDSGKPIVFASQRDCQRAIDSLAEAGIVDDAGFANLDDETGLRIIYGQLYW